MRTSKQCCGWFMSRFILSAIWQTSPKDREWSSLLHQRGKNNMSAEQLEKEHIRERFFVQIYPAPLVQHSLWYKLTHIDIFYIRNLKLILPNMNGYEWSSLKSWKARKYQPQNLPSSPHPVFWVIPQQFRRWGVYDLWQTTILLDLPPLAVNHG